MAGVINALNEENQKNGKDAHERGQEVVHQVTVMLNTIMVIGFIVAIGLGLLVTRIITRQVGGEPDAAVEALRRLADGDLAIRISCAPAMKTACCTACSKPSAALPIS